MHFQTKDELKKKVKHYLHNMAGEFYDKGIQKMPQHMQKCIDRNDYIEK